MPTEVLMVAEKYRACVQLAYEPGIIMERILETAE